MGGDVKDGTFYSFEHASLLRHAFVSAALIIWASIILQCISLSNKEQLLEFSPVS